MQKLTQDTVPHTSLSRIFCKPEDHVSPAVLASAFFGTRDRFNAQEVFEAGLKDKEANEKFELNHLQTLREMISAVSRLIFASKYSSEWRLVGIRI